MNLNNIIPNFSNSNISGGINPNYITGIADAESNFHIQLTKNLKSKTG